ncbi:MAG: OFA family MFS transporter [Gallionella sp.]|jgi:MFS family permease
MTTPNLSTGTPSGWLARERTVARAGFNRWLVPPAALAIHLCIGMAYGFSVFWLPLSKAVGITTQVACPAESGLIDALFATSCDWKISDLGWMYTLFFLLLGSSAAIWGGWLERVGPRRAGFTAAVCWGGGLLISAYGVYIHQLWLMWLGSGFIGGIGLGLGYISPVSTLIKWFPDKRGMATGMAIMGFGGGAMIGAPLANMLMEHFRTPTSIGVWETFATMGVVYFIAMTCGAFGYRVPPTGWKLEGWSRPETQHALISDNNVHVKNVHKTPQFWLIWAVLCLNVSAGIGVLGMASPMLQEIFSGRLLGLPEVDFVHLNDDQKKSIAALAAGFAGLLSLFNIAGRFFWASLSDTLGRKNTYFVFFALGIAMYSLAPWAAHSGHQALFVAFFCVILSMYGGGFATVPAYLADMFGTQFVGAIHGRLLTAWATAGIIGPVVVNYIREAQINAGVPREQVYDFTMYILASFLVLGFIANWLIKPVDKKWHLTEQEMREIEAAHHQKEVNEELVTGSFGITHGGLDTATALAWTAVGIPIAIGLWITFNKAVILFH